MVKALGHICFFYFVQFFIPIFGPQRSSENFKNLQITDFLRNYYKNNLKLWFLAPKNMYLDTKIKSISSVKLVKSKFKNFHTRVCHLVVNINISATTEPIWKKILQVDQ